MTEPLSDEEVREALTRALGRAPHPALWGYALENGWVGDVRGDLASGLSLGQAVGSLVASCREVEHLFSEMRGGGRSRGETRIGPDRRAEALARIFAADASRLDEVKWFRQRRLRGHLLELASVAGWILRRRRPGAAQVLVSVPDGAGAAPLPTHLLPRHVGTLSYLTGEDPFPRAVILPGAGTLVELKTIASRLAMRYSWAEAEASTFVLTGIPPALPLVRAVIDWRSPWRAATTISLEVHPSTTPAALAGAYRQVRAEVLGRGRRYRAVSESYRADLAAVCAKNNDGRPWAEMMKSWNRHDPSHRYRDVRRFTRDARETYEIIAGEPLEWAGAQRSKHRGASHVAVGTAAT